MNLFPDVPERPTWRQLEQRGRDDAAVHAALHLERQGAASREEILIALALHLSANNERLMKRLVEVVGGQPFARSDKIR